jgi:hypothetical protein
MLMEVGLLFDFADAASGAHLFAISTESMGYKCSGFPTTPISS